MAGTHPIAMLSLPPGRRATEQAAAAVMSLEGGRKVIRNLDVLAHLWFDMASCFRRPERATPTVEALRVVATFTDDADVHVAIAALVALRSAAHALFHVVDAPVPSWADVPECVEATRRALMDERVLVRLAASRLVADHPTRALTSELAVLLVDPIGTVRRHAGIALAALDG